MLAYAFTYNQLLPEFLDLIFPFGKTDFPRDSQYSCLRYDSSIGKDSRGLEIPEIGRSGSALRIFYNFKGVESTKTIPEWPWSIRSMAVYHSFDVQTGHSEWVIIKANRLMQKRVTAIMDLHRSGADTTLGKVERAFRFSLGIHQLFGDYAAEGWRWYINFLEDEFQIMSRHALAISMEGQSETQTSISHPTGHNASFPMASKRVSSQVATTRATKPKERSTSRWLNMPLPPSSIVPNHPIRQPQHVGSPHNSGANFEFSDLQKIQHLEEKATESILTLRSNSSILSELIDAYTSQTACPDWPLPPSSLKATQQLLKEVKKNQKDLQLQITRTESLLQMLGNRKTLLHAILEYKNMQASKVVAERAQHSATFMEHVTGKMYEIAEKTQQETVSMRIITLVTLFFLPGTFISTLMSTDIIRWNPNADGILVKTMSSDALALYLAITLPLMAITFIAWYGVFCWANTETDGDSWARVRELIGMRRLNSRESEQLEKGQGPSLQKEQYEVFNNASDNI